MKGIEQVKLDSFIVKLGFTRKTFLSLYKAKVQKGIVNINIDIVQRSINYSASFSINLFKKSGQRFFKDIDELKRILSLIIKAIRWTK